MRLLSPLHSYYTFARIDTRFIAFGFVLTLSSNFGQTFFISLFNPHIREALSLSDGQFGGLYSMATLASAFSLVWVGTLVDRMNLRPLTIAICFALCLAAALMAWTPAVVVLLVAIYLLRLNGQGLLGHVAITSMARYFDKSRGKAISIASLGYAAGEAALPLIAVSTIAAIGWRQTWLAIAGVIALAIVPLVLWLLRGHEHRHARYLSDVESDKAELETSTAAHVAVSPVRHWTRGETVRDWRFYLLLPAALMPAFIVTGVFFHQVRLVEEKGWAMAWFAACFIGFAAAQFPTSLAYGEIIDRFGARRAMPFYLIPLALAMLVLAFVVHPAAALIAMVLIGMTSGAVGPLVNSTMAEMYGVKHLGAIRSLSTALMVFSTALSPVLMGALIDVNVPISTMTLGFVGLIFVASVLVAVAVRR